MRRITAIAIASFITGTLTGCATDHTSLKDSNMSNRNLPATPYQILKSGQVPADETEYMHGKHACTVYHTDNAQEMAQFRKLFRTLSGEEAPEVAGTLIVARYGTQRTGGYGFKVKEISDEGRVVKVVLALQKPGNIATQALTNPYMVILLPDLHKDIRVVEVEE
jgi:hypothetical protein